MVIYDTDVECVSSSSSLYLHDLVVFVVFVSSCNDVVQFAVQLCVLAFVALEEGDEADDVLGDLVLLSMVSMRECNFDAPCRPARFRAALVRSRIRRDSGGTLVPRTLCREVAVSQYE